MAAIRDSKGKALWREYEPADTAWKRCRGIMFRQKVEKPLLFSFDEAGRKRNSIHSFFCFARFDAIFLDGAKRVVDVRENVAPFVPLIVPSAPAKYLIECAAGEARKRKVRPGQKLVF